MKKGLLTAERREDQLLFTISIFTAATFFLFGPIQMYLSNISELWFLFDDVIISCLMGFVLAAVGIIGIGALFCFWKIPFYCYLLFTWGFGFALYIQGNLVPMKAGVLNGAGINWNVFQKEAKFSVVIWIACIILPFLLVRFLPKYWKKIIMNCCLTLLAIQFVMVILLCVTTDFSNTKKTDYFLSADGLYDVGKGKNIVYFVLDSYDQQYFEKIYEQKPELISFLDGFTWFTNAINVYPCTAPSIRYLLTNQFYLNDQTFTDWVTEGWTSSDGYYQALRNNRFDIGVYTSEDGAISEEAKTSLIKNAKKQQFGVASHIDLAKSLLHLTAIRYFPDALKQYVWVSDYTSLFEPLKETEDVSVYTWEDADFYHGLVNQGLSLVENNQYHFIHLRGVHEPNSLLEDLTVAEDSRDAVTATEAIACLKILQEYCNQLKALGVYDSTCIIVTADHGDYDRSMGTPILLVKSFDSREPLSVSDAPVSQQNLRATVAAALSLEDAQQYGVSVFDVTKENAEIRKYFRYDGIFGEHEPGYVSPILEYAVQPENNLPESFIYTGKVYSPDGMHETIPYQCAVGKSIQFQTAEDLQYFVSGVSSYVLKSKSVWITEREGKMRFVFDGEESDLVCTITIDPYFTSGQQRLIVTHADEELYNNSVIGGTTEIRFTIPNHCIVNGMLELDFQCPDGLSMWEMGLGQDTEAFLSFPLHQILFTRAVE